MSRPRIIQPGESYTFSKYFELPFTPEDILAELGCSYERERLLLPKSEYDLNKIEDLQRLIERNLRRVKLLSEDARKQAIIAPILLEVCEITQTQLNIEYPVSVSEQLKGSFDYYISKGKGLLVIEAKQADLSRGFTQLAVELIALDQWTKSDTPVLYGAVTTGEDWRFAIYKRQEKQIIEDIKLYRIPEEMMKLVSILIGILIDTSSSAKN
ncbi:hypothetical protein PI95_013015 [Hassallia byssoidea VB512170]|uniref:Type I restriction enzyme R protein N-terminal domain-containing protein n=1 Tax=Hassallia byssoidea VB512170 TaxID=1304833 RepID=A0A846H9S5_9CYAN|nr:hypothetical protein [Hassalia byssoidea]NEU73459.1 hypothetical protein [Hassalia byssoidea VB512170]